MTRDTYTPPLNVSRIEFLDPAPWMEEGACHDSNDPDVFFPENESFRRRVQLAQRICAQCPVKLQCAEYAMARPELIGIWGGLTGADRRRLRRFTA